MGGIEALEKGKTIVWNPIQVVVAPDSGRLALLRALGSKCEEYEALRGKLAKNCLQKIPAPGNKTTKKNNRLTGRGVHMETFRYYNLSKRLAGHSVLAPARRRWGTGNRRRNSNTPESFWKMR